MTDEQEKIRERDFMSARTERHGHRYHHIDDQVAYSLFITVMSNHCFACGFDM